MIRLLYLALLCFLYACSPTLHYQVYSTSCDNCSRVDSVYYGGNDSVEIEYFFWNENGTMLFAIHNHMNRPIYIDWKRSGFYSNGEGYEYWQDEQTVSTISATGTYSQDLYSRSWNRPQWITYSASVGRSESIIQKKERVTYIISNSTYLKQPQVYSILPQDIVLPIDEHLQKASTTLENEKQYMYQVVLPRDQSPYLFRSYITWSFAENDPDGILIDNTFAITGIKEITQKQFKLQYPAAYPTMFFKVIREHGHAVEDRLEDTNP